MFCCFAILSFGNVNLMVDEMEGRRAGEKIYAFIDERANGVKFFSLEFGNIHTSQSHVLRVTHAWKGLRLRQPQLWIVGIDVDVISF